MQIYFKTMRIAKKLYLFYVSFVFLIKRNLWVVLCIFIIAFNMCLLVIESGLLLFFLVLSYKF